MRYVGSFSFWGQCKSSKRSRKPDHARPVWACVEVVPLIAPLVPLQRSLVRRSQPSTSPLRPSGVPNRSTESPTDDLSDASQHRDPSHTSTTSTHPREIPANGAQTYLTDDLLGADVVGTCGLGVRGVASSGLTVDKGVPDHDGRVVLSGDVRDVNASCKCASCCCMDGSVGSGLGKGRIDLFFQLFYAINPTPARPDFQRRLRGFHLYLPVTASPYSTAPQLHHGRLARSRRLCCQAVSYSHLSNM